MSRVLGTVLYEWIDLSIRVFIKFLKLFSGHDRQVGY